MTHYNFNKNLSNDIDIFSGKWQYAAEDAYHRTTLVRNFLVNNKSKLPFNCMIDYQEIGAYIFWINIPKNVLISVICPPDLHYHDYFIVEVNLYKNNTPICSSKVNYPNKINSSYHQNNLLAEINSLAALVI